MSERAPKPNPAPEQPGFAPDVDAMLAANAEAHQELNRQEAERRAAEQAERGAKLQEPWLGDQSVEGKSHGELSKQANVAKSFKSYLEGRPGGPAEGPKTEGDPDAPFHTRTTTVKEVIASSTAADRGHYYDSLKGQNDRVITDALPAADRRLKEGDYSYKAENEIAAAREAGNHTLADRLEQRVRQNAKVGESIADKMFREQEAAKTAAETLDRSKVDARSLDLLDRLNGKKPAGTKGKDAAPKAEEAETPAPEPEKPVQEQLADEGAASQPETEAAGGEAKAEAEQTQVDDAAQESDKPQAGNDEEIVDAELVDEDEAPSDQQAAEDLPDLDGEIVEDDATDEANKGIIQEEGQLEVTTQSGDVDPADAVDSDEVKDAADERRNDHETENDEEGLTHDLLMRADAYVMGNEEVTAAGLKQKLGISRERADELVDLYTELGAIRPTRWTRVDTSPLTREDIAELFSLDPQNKDDEKKLDANFSKYQEASAGRLPTPAELSAALNVPFAQALAISRRQAEAHAALDERQEVGYTVIKAQLKKYLNAEESALREGHEYGADQEAYANQVIRDRLNLYKEEVEAALEEARAERLSKFRARFLLNDRFEEKVKSEYTLRGEERTRTSTRYRPREIEEITSEHVIDDVRYELRREKVKGADGKYAFTHGRELNDEEIRRTVTRLLEDYQENPDKYYDKNDRPKGDLQQSIYEAQQEEQNERSGSRGNRRMRTPRFLGRLATRLDNTGSSTMPLDPEERAHQPGYTPELTDAILRAHEGRRDNRRRGEAQPADTQADTQDHDADTDRLTLDDIVAGRQQREADDHAAPADEPAAPNDIPRSVVGEDGKVRPNAERPIRLMARAREAEAEAAGVSREQFVRRIAEDDTIPEPSRRIMLDELGIKVRGPEQQAPRQQGRRRTVRERVSARMTHWMDRLASNDPKVQAVMGRIIETSANNDAINEELKNKQPANGHSNGTVRDGKTRRPAR